MTHQDTLKAQETLLKLIAVKIQYSFLTDKEKIVLPTLLANSFLSQSNECKIKPKIKIGDRTYILGHDIHHFGLRLMDMQVNNGKIKIAGNEINASLLWKLLKH